MTTITITADRDGIRAQLAEMAQAAGRELCGRCAGSLTLPCRMCRRQHRRILDADEIGQPHVAIAVDVRLPAWRVTAIIEHHQATQEPSDTEEVLRSDLDDIAVDLLIAKEPSDRDKGREHRYYRDVLLAAGDYTLKGARSVLNGTHIPTRPLRNAYLEAQRHDPSITYVSMAARLHMAGDSHFARAIGLRTDSLKTFRRQDGSLARAGGGIRCAIEIGLAGRIAAELGLAPGEIPGL